MQAVLSRQLSAPYAEVGRMPYGDALVAHVQFARLDQDRLEAWERARAGSGPA